MSVRFVFTLLVLCMLIGCSQPDMTEKFGEDVKKTGVSKLESVSEIPKPESYEEIVDRVHGIKFYLPKGWVYTVNGGVASFYDPSYSGGVIVIPLSDAKTGLEKIVEHFSSAKKILAKGNEKKYNLILRI